MRDKVPDAELKRFFNACLNATSTLKNTEDSFRGFVVGFRCYERMITVLGREMSTQEAKRFFSNKVEESKHPHGCKVGERPGD